MRPIPWAIIVWDPTGRASSGDGRSRKSVELTGGASAERRRLTNGSLRARGDEEAARDRATDHRRRSPSPDDHSPTDTSNAVWPGGLRVGRPGGRREGRGCGGCHGEPDDAAGIVVVV